MSPYLPIITMLPSCICVGLAQLLHPCWTAIPADTWNVPRSVCTVAMERGPTVDHPINHRLHIVLRKLGSPSKQHGPK